MRGLLYIRALIGLTGVDDPYRRATSLEVVRCTVHEALGETVDKILELMQARLGLISVCEEASV